MKLQEYIQVLVVLKELHFNFNRSEYLFAFIFASTKNPGMEILVGSSSLPAGTTKCVSTIAVSDKCSLSAFQTICNTLRKHLCVCNPGEDVETDTIVFGDAFCSLVVQQNKVTCCSHETLVRPASHHIATIRNSLHQNSTEISM